MSQILHKEFDFTQPGGFPLTQERLQYMQEATGEALTSLIAAGGSLNGPMILSGMHITKPWPDTYIITNGWLIYHGCLVKFTGGSVVVAVGDVPLVTITNTPTDLLFYNTSTPPVQLSATATLISAPSLTDDTHFPLLTANEWASGVGLQQRDEDWQAFNFADSYGTITSGLISYKRNRFTNTLHIKGEIYVLDAQDHLAWTYSATGAELAIVFGPLAYVPGAIGSSGRVQIPNCVTVPSNPDAPVFTYSDSNYLNSWKIEIDNTGMFHTNIIRPHSSITQYRVYINHILSLD